MVRRATALVVDLEIASTGLWAQIAGEVLVKELQRANVDISRVRRVAAAATRALSSQEDEARVRSVVNKGANHGVAFELLRRTPGPEVVQSRAPECC